MYRFYELPASRPVRALNPRSSIEAEIDIRLARKFIECAFDAMRLADRAAERFDSAPRLEKNRLSTIANLHYERAIGRLERAVRRLNRATEHELSPRLRTYVAAKTLYCKMQIEACLRLFISEGDAAPALAC